MDLLKAFEENLKSGKLVSPGEQIWVACSGGPDSVALLSLFCRIAVSWRLKLGLLHFNHGLRGPAADRDECFVRDLAKRSGIPCYCGRGKVARLRRSQNLSLEEAARKMRYDFFIRAARKHRVRKIALAHTRDDQAETVLMRILQGTGLRGLAGIRRSLSAGGRSFVRPLLDFGKAEILDWLRRNRLRFRTDSSNRSLAMVRNRIRRKLLPWIEKEINPRAAHALARIPAILEDENRMMIQLEKEAWKAAFGGLRSGRLTLRRKIFSELSPPLQFRVIDRALKRINPASGLSFAAWMTLRPRLLRPRDRHSLPKSIDLIVS
ncbi:MAG: tRNA lysidine(34) synthetase TilS, partial [Candidatus Omnitrophota bacterium]